MAIYFGKTIEEKLALADAYFAPSNHPMGNRWSGYGDDERKASLQHAERKINLWLRGDLESAFSETDFPVSDCPNYRPDYAVMEQGLFILDNTDRKQDNGLKSLINNEEYDRIERTTGITLCPEASQWIQKPSVKVSQ